MIGCGCGFWAKNRPEMDSHRSGCDEPERKGRKSGYVRTGQLTRTIICSVCGATCIVLRHSRPPVTCERKACIDEHRRRRCGRPSRPIDLVVAEVIQEAGSMASAPSKRMTIPEGPEERARLLRLAAAAILQILDIDIDNQRRGK